MDNEGIFLINIWYQVQRVRQELLKTFPKSYEDCCFPHPSWASKWAKGLGNSWKLNRAAASGPCVQETDLIQDCRNPRSLTPILLLGVFMRLYPNCARHDYCFWNSSNFSLQGSCCPSALWSLILASSYGYGCHAEDKVTHCWSANEFLGSLCLPWCKQPSSHLWREEQSLISDEKSKVSHKEAHPWEGKENPALILYPLDVSFGSYIFIYGVSNKTIKKTVLDGLPATLALKLIWSRPKSAC